MAKTNRTVTWTTIRTNHSLQWHTVINLSIQTGLPFVKLFKFLFLEMSHYVSFVIDSCLHVSVSAAFEDFLSQRESNIKNLWTTTTSNQLFNYILSDLTLRVTDKNKCVEQVTRKIKWKEISRGVELQSLFPRPHPLFLHKKHVF